MPLPSDYVERVYAGVLGKIIGVYLGRPFEGWPYDRIMAELGEIQYYVHEQRKTTLVVTDDDISGTFTFLRRVDGMDESSLGKLWRPIYFTSTGYAVHGSSSVPPWPASHGCVRVSNAAIDMVWAQGLMPVGSTIRIR